VFVREEYGRETKEGVVKIKPGATRSRFGIRNHLLSLVLVLLVCSLGRAQLDTGTISGTVTDQSGGAIPGATIAIRNVETGVTRSLPTNAAGRYEAVALPVGNYEVRASLTGFQTLVRSGITLTVGRNAVVDMALQVGEVAQSVTVTGEASFVETTTATVSNLVDEKRVTDIPLNNRDLTGLAFLQGCGDGGLGPKVVRSGWKGYLQHVPAGRRLERGHVRQRGVCRRCL
jgi:hypothetical protein